MLLGVDVARSRHLELEGVGLLGRGVCLAGLLGAFALLLLLETLAFLLLGLDVAPCELEGFGRAHELAYRVVLVVDYLAAYGVGQLGGRQVEPQCHRITSDGLRVVYDLLFGNAVEAYALDLRVPCPEVEHCLVAVRAGGLLEHLAFEDVIGEHAEVELRLGRRVHAQRVVPYCEVGQLGGVVGPFEEADLVGAGLVHLVVVGILEGVYPVGYRLEVLRDEYAVVLGPGYDVGLAVEDCRVVAGRLGQAVGDVEVDEALAYAVGHVAVGRVSRAYHRVDLAARREDVAGGMQRVALVVVADGAAEVEGIGGVFEQCVPDLYGHAAAAYGERRLLLHRG